ncbi:hypothetical protein KOSB73_100023 [Klebsiella grimontii]|uniref:Uncharacterized protein n=2 Tax=Klebsiella TaxID=570 RepID=A0A285AUY9_9ENTR|nr:hypothetical protein KOSB73_100023 [Klebsiella grimontii]
MVGIEFTKTIYSVLVEMAYAVIYHPEVTNRLNLYFSGIKKSVESYFLKVNQLRVVEMQT